MHTTSKTNFAGIDLGSDEMNEWLREQIERIYEVAKKEVEKAKRNAYTDFLKIYEEKINIIFNSAIQRFYSEYTPKFYDRNESLYDLLELDRFEGVNGPSMSMSFNPNNITGFRGSGYTGEDGLYDQVFRKGWHGGAGSGKGHPELRVPYWRTPVPDGRRIKTGGYFRWGIPAEIAEISPLDDIKRMLNDYMSNQMNIDFNKIWDIHKKNIKIEI